MKYWTVSGSFNYFITRDSTIWRMDKNTKKKQDRRRWP